MNEVEKTIISRQNLIDRIKELEAERDRLEERLGDWQRETALAKADRDRLREALQTIADECDIEFQWAYNVANAALKEQT